MPHRCVCANCGNIKDVAKNISLHTVPYYGNERPEQKRRRKRWVDFVKPNAHTGNLRRLRILQLLYCRVPGYLLLWQDVVFLITVVCLLILSLALQCIKLRAKSRFRSFSYGCVFVIAPLRFVTVRFVLRELNIFLLCFDYAIE